MKYRNKSAKILIGQHLASLLTEKAWCSQLYNLFTLNRVPVIMR